MKIGLPKTTAKVKELIKEGFDFESNIIVEGSFLFPMPSLNRDALPHVADLRKAGAEDDEIAYYFAYHIVYGHEVVAISKDGKVYSLDTPETVNIADDFRIRKIEDKYFDVAMDFKKEREKEERQTKIANEKTTVL